ncbi:MAG: tail fiber protein, partial [Cytophagales bacterium]|nr:tail fiber protein [Cytophagales bacterium]
GSTYGGDGRRTFALPDMRGCVAVSSGTGPGLSHRILGERIGTETVTLNEAQIPYHAHDSRFGMNKSVHPKVSIAKTANTSSPKDAYPADAGLGKNNYSSSGTKIQMAPDAKIAFGLETSIGNTGESKAHSNMQPVLVVNYIICMQGVFPPRS